MKIRLVVRSISGDRIVLAAEKPTEDHVKAAIEVVKATEPGAEREKKLREIHPNLLNFSAPPDCIVTIGPFHDEVLEAFPAGKTATLEL